MLHSTQKGIKREGGRKAESREVERLLTGRTEKTLNNKTDP